MILFDDDNDGRMNDFNVLTLTHTHTLNKYIAKV